MLLQSSRSYAQVRRQMPEWKGEWFHSELSGAHCDPIESTYGPGVSRAVAEKFEPLERGWFPTAQLASEYKRQQTLLRKMVSEAHEQVQATAVSPQRLCVRKRGALRLKERDQSPKRTVRAPSLPSGSPRKLSPGEERWFEALPFSELEECRTTSKTITYVAAPRAEFVARPEEAANLPLHKLFYDPKDEGWRAVEAVMQSELHVAGKHPRFLVPLGAIEYVTQRLRFGKRGPIWKNHYRVQGPKLKSYRRVLHEDKGEGLALEEIVPREQLLLIHRLGRGMSNPKVFLDSDSGCSF